ncbi:MAG: hypothetical protein CM1200mP20_12740 [Pseudomonadota bacterium]|nr:MAG: hypothetical protein CM1200mP20_12740 [Pseudomonadota bacterium]
MPNGHKAVRLQLDPPRSRESGKSSENFPGLVGCQSGADRCARARGVSRIQAVDVKSEVHLVVTHHPTDFFDDGVGTVALDPRSVEEN